MIDYLLGARKTPTAITVNNFYDGEKDQHTVLGPVVGDVSPLQAVSVYLSAAGQATPKVIAADTGLSEAAIVRVLDDHPDRFHVNGSKYSLAK